MARYKNGYMLMEHMYKCHNIVKLECETITDQPTKLPEKVLEVLAHLLCGR